MRARLLARVGCAMLAAVAASISGERPAGTGAPAAVTAPARSTSTASAGDCSFSRNPSRFRDALRLHMEELSTRTERAVALRAASATTAMATLGSRSNAAAPTAAAAEFAPSDVPERNYIDSWIFDKMAQAPYDKNASAAQSSQRGNIVEA